MVAAVWVRFAYGSVGSFSQPDSFKKVTLLIPPLDPIQVELISLDEASKLLLGDAHNSSLMTTTTTLEHEFMHLNPRKTTGQLINVNEDEFVVVVLATINGIVSPTSSPLSSGVFLKALAGAEVAGLSCELKIPKTLKGLNTGCLTFWISCF